jgi:hypothetical protein
MGSTRRANKSRKTVKEESLPCDSGEEYEERTPEPSKTRGTKRARTAKTTAKDKGGQKRRKKAKLSMLPEMPVDILYEVGIPLFCRAFVDAEWLPDIFPCSPKGPASYLLDRKGFQSVPH